ncbi:MAG: shikimate dehydrogenase [Rubrivivax sp.]
MITAHATPSSAKLDADRYAVLGNPVAHSQSPFIHAAFAQQTGEALAYDRVLCSMDGFVAAVDAFAAAGGRGCNVTLPFKFEAGALAPRCSERAALAGAANVLRFGGPRGSRAGWSADNTDGIGLVRDIECGAGVSIVGRRVLLIGAGGGAAGALGPLLQARPQALWVVNRSADKAAALIARHAPLARMCGVALDGGALGLAHSERLGRFDLLINASASSLHGLPVPVPAARLAPGALALDLMYGPSTAAFIAWATAAGALARDGLGMLVEQAAEAFWFWRGVRPQTGPVLQALRARLDADVARR